MTVLRESEPRILGGRDLEAGGTWLAVNEHGVVAGLTNLPSRQVPRDASKRSRGELPLFLAGYASAEEAVEAFCHEFKPADFNRCWLLVGDRDRLFYIDMAGETLAPRLLEPGVHILENQPIEAESAKVDFVAHALDGIKAQSGQSLISALRRVLSNHGPEGRETAPRIAPCVHNGAYGTRSSEIIVVPAQTDCLPEVFYTDGPPCTSAVQDAAGLWRQAGSGGA